MHPQELSIDLPAQGAQRATEEGSTNGWQKPQRLSARQKTEVVLRLLRGEPLDLVSRDLGIPAVRLTTWCEAFHAAGQDALKNPRYRCSRSSVQQSHRRRCITGVDHVFKRQELMWCISQRIHTCDTPSSRRGAYARATALRHRMPWARAWGRSFVWALRTPCHGGAPS